VKGEIAKPFGSLSNLKVLRVKIQPVMVLDRSALEFEI
jgi:hypothetical protein